ncbi:MAG: uroporphyrinogen-III C-methyltransferase [Acidobacteriaceae bacterium]
MKAMQTAESGKVYLTGAGPGDPDLLTVRARDLLATADVILHDGLVVEEILELASPTARVESVAKRAGVKTITQEQIVERMIREARAGQSVIRLKVGDPMLFGRGAEEIVALTAAGIPFEIVPGVTAALAAAAALACPLTSREASSAVVMLSGHRSEEGRSLILPGGFAEATLAIYMPGPDYAALARDLTEHGMPEATPCAVVSQCSLPGQQVIRLTLGELPTHSALPAPAMVLVGRVLGS